MLYKMQPIDILTLWGSFKDERCHLLVDNTGSLKAQIAPLDLPPISLVFASTSSTLMMQGTYP